MSTEGSPPPAPTTRKTLARLRKRWQEHTPATPLCLAEEVEPGVTIAEFCVRQLLAQRNKRAAA